MKAKILIAWLMVFLAVIVAACSNGNEEEDKAATPVANDASAQTSQAEGETNGDAGSSEAIDPFARYEEPVEVSMGIFFNPGDKTLPEGDTPSNNIYTRFLEEKMNVKVKAEWQAPFGEAYNQKIKLVIASNDMPDAMQIFNYDDLQSLIKNDMLEDLTDVVDQYAPPVIKDIYASTNGEAFKAATVNGRLYAIPFVRPTADSVNLLWIRKDWLDQLGLQPPKTLEDVEAIAMAFKENNPNGFKDAVGLPGNKSILGLNNANYSFNSIFNVYHAYPLNWLKDASGNITYGSIQPEVKEALGRLRDMYAEGIIDKEFALRQDVNELIISGKAGMMFYPWWAPYYPLNEAMKQDPEAEWVPYLAPFDGEGVFNTQISATTDSWMVVRKGYEHPEAVVKAVSLMNHDKNDPEIQALAATGVSDENNPFRIILGYADRLERISKSIHDVLEGSAKAEELTGDAKRMYDHYMASKDDPINHLESWTNGYSYVAGGKPLLEPMNKVPSEFTGLTKTMMTKMANLEKLRDEVFIKIIMGDAPLDAFDQFVIDWKKQGGDEITAEVQAAVQQ